MIIKLKSSAKPVSLSTPIFYDILSLLFLSSSHTNHPYHILSCLRAKRIHPCRLMDHREQPLPHYRRSICPWYYHGTQKSSFHLGRHSIQ